MSTKSRIRWAIRGLLALLLVALVFQRVRSRHEPHLQGFLVRPITTECDPTRTDGYRDLRLSITADRKMRINMDEVPPDELQPRLHDIEATRAQKVLFVDASEDLSLQDVVDVLERSRQAGPDLRIVLVGPKDRERCAYAWRSFPAGAGADRGAY